MRKRETIDGNEAAAYISYAFTEVATIYPITPSSPMAEHVDAWSAKGIKNLFGQPVKLVEMQSEHGAAGAMHGALETGALATSYTASQGLMLMIPLMYRLSGQLHPGVLHVSARTLGTHAFSIFGDHSDVMACRQTGFAMFSTSSVQEIMDLAGVAHLAAIEGRVPFLHFFDGFRTSHEIQKVEVLEYSELEPLLNQGALNSFRKRALNANHPVQRSTAQNPDIFFQHRESVNRYYDALPGIVEKFMEEINKITGRDYKLFNYYGVKDAERVIVAMGSACETACEVVDYLVKNGEKVGLLQVHLYRPFSTKHFLSMLPKTVKIITVLDRTKEPGAIGEPLHQDVCTVFTGVKNAPEILAGRYGLSSKDVTPTQIKTVFDNMLIDEPKKRFTVGITDDITNLSLKLSTYIDTSNNEAISCKFWGLGSDGTVGANKNSVKIIGDYTDQYVQAYFEYDTKKSGGVTKSHLRFSEKPIRSTYYVTNADFVACHNKSYIDKYDIVTEIKPGGTFLLNCNWDKDELGNRLPAKVKRTLAQNNIKFYIIDATSIAQEIGLGNKANAVLQSAFFRLSKVLPLDIAINHMKSAVRKSYASKGEKVVSMNWAAIERGVAGVVEIKIPESWRDAQEEPLSTDNNEPKYIKEILRPVNALKGDTLPVSVFWDAEDGTVPLGTSKYEKRGIATFVPEWIQKNCIQCNQCSYVCPHAAIRPFLLTSEDANNAPEGLLSCEANSKGMEDYLLRIQVDPLDCTGCGCCAEICPAKNKALVMVPLDRQMSEMHNWDYLLSLPKKKNPLDKFSIKGSQFEQPLLEFSGACAGCGETPYMKLLTQLFGDRMIIANATGCTQAWGAANPCVPYTTNHKGCGPAFSNSLFENNAEFSLGMCLSMKQQRERLSAKIEALLSETKDSNLRLILQNWIDNYSKNEDTHLRAEEVIQAVKKVNNNEIANYILGNSEHLIKHSMWMYGGDGWAYDIGYGGLDHVLSTGEDINILVVDTEVYSNTGGQSSKATPIGAVAQFASSGKKNAKKDLGLLAATYGNIYVAQVSMGANPAHLIKVLKEAESFMGPSLIIAYAPCINHGIVKGMAYSQAESKLAVESGYWHLFRYDPRRKENGENPFILDSKKPKVSLKEFMLGEIRFAALERTYPEEAQKLLALAEKHANEKYNQYVKLAVG